MTIHKDAGYVPPVDARDSLPPVVYKENLPSEPKKTSKVAVAGGTAFSGLSSEEGKLKVKKVAEHVISVVGENKATASNSN